MVRYAKPHALRLAKLERLQYTDEEWEFVRAMERFKKVNRIRFPTFADCLAVAVALGYRKVPPTEQRSSLPQE